MKTTLVRMITLVYWIPISAHTTYIARVLVWSSSKSKSINDVSKVIEYSLAIIKLYISSRKKMFKKILEIICSKAMPMCCQKVYAWHSGDILLFCSKNPFLQCTLLKRVLIILIFLIYIFCLFKGTFSFENGVLAWRIESVFAERIWIGMIFHSSLTPDHRARPCMAKFSHHLAGCLRTSPIKTCPNKCNTV